MRCNSSTQPKIESIVNENGKITRQALLLSSCLDNYDKLKSLNDVGLLAAMAGISPKTIIQGNELFEEFKGVITEQFVCQQINAKSIPCYYWSPEGGTSEVDFVIQSGDEVVPIEVKSGLNVRSRSLRVCYDKYQPTRCIRTSLAAYEEQSWMTNIPLYSFLQWLKMSNKLFL